MPLRIDPDTGESVFDPTLAEARLFDNTQAPEEEQQYSGPQVGFGGATAREYGSGLAKIVPTSLQSWRLLSESVGIPAATQYLAEQAARYATDQPFEDPKTFAGRRAKAVIEHDPLYEAATDFNRQVDETYGYDPRGLSKSEREWAQRLGGLGASVTGSIATGPLGIAGLAATAGGQTFAPGVEEALRNGASPEAALLQGAVESGAEIGSEYALGIPGKLLRGTRKVPILRSLFRNRAIPPRIPKPTGLVRELAEGALGEAVEEPLSGAVSDLSAAYLTGTDPSRGVTGSPGALKRFLGRRAEESLLGGIGGFGFAPVIIGHHFAGEGSEPITGVPEALAGGDKVLADARAAAGAVPVGGRRTGPTPAGAAAASVVDESTETAKKVGTAWEGYSKEASEPFDLGPGSSSKNANEVVQAYWPGAVVREDPNRRRITTYSGPASVGDQASFWTEGDQPRRVTGTLVGPDPNTAGNLVVRTGTEVQSIPAAKIQFRANPHIQLTQSAPGEYVLDSSAMGPGRKGDRLYQAAYQWAANNGFKIVRDDTTTRAGNVRRNAAGLSSALRTGTTAHIDPTDAQLMFMYPEMFRAAGQEPSLDPFEVIADSDVADAARERWSKSGFDERVGRMAMAEAGMVEHVFPKVVDYYGSTDVAGAVTAANDPKNPDSVMRLGRRTIARYFATKAAMEGAPVRETGGATAAGVGARVLMSPEGAGAAPVVLPAENQAALASIPEGAGAAEPKNWQPPAQKRPASPQEAATLPPNQLRDFDKRLGTRNPDADSATENPLEGDTVISTEEVLRLDRKKQEQLADYFRGYGAFPGLSGLTPQAVFARVQGQMLQTLRFLYKRIPKEVLAWTRRWYAGARNMTDRWSKNFNLPTQSVAGVIAVLSPQQDWFHNAAMAFRIITHWQKLKGSDQTATRAMMGRMSPPERQAVEGIPFSELSDLGKAIFIRTWDQAYHKAEYLQYSPDGVSVGLARNTDGTPATLPWGQSYDFVAKAVRILESGGDLKVINDALGAAHKVRNFYSNIMFPDWIRGDITSDTHAVAALMMIPFGGEDPEVKQNFGGSTSPAKFDKAVENVRKALAKAGISDDLPSVLGRAMPVRPKRFASPQERYFWGTTMRIVEAGMAGRIEDGKVKGANWTKADYAVARAYSDLMAIQWVPQMPSVGSGVLGVSGSYGILADVFRQFAQETGMLPREAQSIFWEAIRSVFPDVYKDSYAKLHARQEWDKFRRGAQTIEKTHEAIWKRALGNQTTVPSPGWFDLVSKGAVPLPERVVSDAGTPVGAGAANIGTGVPGLGLERGTGGPGAGAGGGVATDVQGPAAGGGGVVPGQPGAVSAPVEGAGAAGSGIFAGNTVTQQMPDGTVVTGTVQAIDDAAGTRWVVRDANGVEHPLQRNAQVRKSRSARREGERQDAIEEALIQQEETERMEREQAVTPARETAPDPNAPEEPAAQPAGPATPDAAATIESTRQVAARMGAEVVVSDTTPGGNPMRNPAIATMGPDGRVTITVTPATVAGDPTQLASIMDEELRHAALLAFMRDKLAQEGFTGDFWVETHGRFAAIFDGLDPDVQDMVQRGIQRIYGAPNLDPGLQIMELLRMASQARNRGMDGLTEKSTRAPLIDRVMEFFREFQNWLVQQFEGKGNLPEPLLELYNRTEELLQYATKAQNFADQHHEVWQHRGVLLNLRRLAARLEQTAMRTRMFVTLERDLTRIADEANVHALGATHVRQRFSPASATFPADIGAYRPLSAQELERWHAYQDELTVRRGATLMRELKRLEAIQDDALGATFERRLAAAAPGSTVAPPSWSAFDLQPIQNQIEAVRQRLNTLFPAAGPRVTSGELARSNALRTRATELNDEIADRPSVKAARSVLENPVVAEWLRTIDQIEASGLEPQDIPVDPNIQGARNVATNRFRHTFRQFRDNVEQGAETNRNRILEKVRAIRARLRESRLATADATLGIRDIMMAVVGRFSGQAGLDERAAAHNLLEQDRAIELMAEELARTDDPNSSIQQLRYGIMSNITPGLQIVRDVAARAGVSEDAINRILAMTNESPATRNGILEIFDGAVDRGNNALANDLEQIEDVYTTPAVGRAGMAARRRNVRRMGFQAVGRARERARESRVRTRTETEELSQIMQDEAEQNFLEDITNEMTVEDPTDTRRMLFRASDGEVLDSFEKVQKTGEPPGTQTAVKLIPGEPYDTELLRRLVEWRNNAVQASQEPATLGTGITNPNDAPTRKGLVVALGLVDNLIEKNYTPEQLAKATLGPNAGTRFITNGVIAIREHLPKLLPGIWGRRLGEAGTFFVEAARRLDALFASSKDEQVQRSVQVMKDLGLKKNNEAHQTQLRLAKNEVAHRLRQFGSGVRAGDSFVTTEALRGKIGKNGRPISVPQSLIDLLEFERGVFKKAQAIEAQFAYGGIHEEHGGRHYVRPAAETGDIGMGRNVNLDKLKLLADAYGRVQPDAAGNYSHTLPGLVDFWNQNPQDVLSHIMDSTRSDLGGFRDPRIQAAEERLAKDIRAGRATIPQSIDDFALALAARMSIPNARDVAFDALMRELGWYGARARAIKKMPAPGTPDTPITGAGKFSGESEISEFTSPAARLNLPGSYYEYGAGESFRAAIERVANTPQVAFYDTVRQGIDHLKSIRSQIEAMGERPLPPALRAEADWIGGKGTSSKRARALMATHISNLEKVMTTRGVAQAPTPWAKFLTLPFPYWLSTIGPMVGNIAGGTQMAYSNLAAMYGPLAAIPMTMIATGASLAYAPFGFAANLMRRLTPTFAKTLQPVFDSMGSAERNAFLEAMGLAHSYSDTEAGNLDEFIKSPAGRIARGPGQWLAKKVSPAVGVRASDTVQNRATMLFMPMFGRGLLKAARRFAQDPGTGWGSLPSHGDRLKIAQMREILGNLGYDPETFLRQMMLPNSDPNHIDWFRLWRGNGAKLARWIVDQNNAANRLNRPQASTFMSLLGWLTSLTAKTIDLTRQIPDRSVTQRAIRPLSVVAGTAATTLIAGILTDVMKNGQKASQDMVMEALRDLLPEIAKAAGGGGGDDDDEDEKLSAAARVGHALVDFVNDRLIPSLKGGKPVETPFDPSFRQKNPVEVAEYAIQQAARPWAPLARGGSIRTPALGAAESVVKALGYGTMGGYEAAKGVVEDNLVGLPPGVPKAGWVKGKARLGQAVQTLANSFGALGSMTAGIISGDSNVDAAPVAVLNAARAAGIKLPPRPDFGSGKIWTPEPIQRPMIIAGIKASSTNPETAAEGVSEIQELATILWRRSYDRAKNAQQPEYEARKTANTAVSQIVADMNPIERGLGRSVTWEELGKLEAMLRNAPPAVQQRIEAEKLGQRKVAAVLTGNPPKGVGPITYPSFSAFTPVRLPAQGPKSEGYIPKGASGRLRSRLRMVPGGEQ